jgi:hypothetical protein
MILEKLYNTVNTPSNSNTEIDIINRIADEYGLEGASKKLLFAIRKVENGKQGKEFGVLNPEAMRYANDPDAMKSFETQARWAAGTIQKRFHGDIDAFAKRWAPVGASNDPNGLNKNWIKNIKFYMK